MSPYSQGIWDGTCGIYAALNAIQYLNGSFSDEDGNNLLAAIVDFYGKDFNSVIKDGIDDIPVEIILLHLKSVAKVKHLVDNLYVVKPPFSDNKEEIFDEIRSSFIQQKMIVYVGITDYIEGGHWTLIKSIDDQKAYFFDSVGMKSRRLSNIIISAEEEPKPVGQQTFIKPTEIQYVVKQG